MSSSRKSVIEARNLLLNAMSADRIEKEIPPKSDQVGKFLEKYARDKEGFKKIRFSVKGKIIP